MNRELILALIVIVGVALLTISQMSGPIRAIWLAQQAQRWPTTKGTVLQSEQRRVSSFTLSINRYQVLFSYEYWVNTRRFTNDVISFSDAAMTEQFNGLRNRRNALRIVRNYPEASQVVVHYHPQDPQIAVLETRIIDGNLILMVILGLALWFFLWLLLSNYLV